MPLTNIFSLWEYFSIVEKLAVHAGLEQNYSFKLTVC